MKTSFLPKITSYILLLLAVLCYLRPAQTAAQCLSNPVGPGTIAGNAPPQNVSITTTPASLANSVTWSNGATGSNITFTPSCSSPGNKTLTPCFLAGTTIPAQSFNVPNFSGTAPASFSFTVSGLCYGPGATYSGALPINIGGTGDVTITLILPDGSTLAPPPLPISTVNALSPIDISLFGLQGDPNGTWTISIGGGATTYNIGPATFFINQYNLTQTFCGPPVQFTVTPCPAPCPVFQSVIGPAQVCSGANTQLAVQFNVPQVFNASYQWTGPDGFTSTAAQPIVNPINNTCDPINVTYSVSVWCTNDNSVLATNQPVTFTVFPAIDPSQILIDNTSSIQDPGCAITISAPCGFTINGTPTNLTQSFNPGDNGTSATFNISNGLPGCTYTVDVPVTCVGSCTPPDVTITTSCLIDFSAFRINLTVNNMGDSQSFIALPSQGVQIPINAPGSYTLGPYPNNEYVNVKLLNLLNPSCNVNLGNFTKGCKPCPTLNNVVTNFQSSPNACEGDIITLNANVNSGIQNVDYLIKWKANGEYIPGGIGSPYSYVLTAPGCEVNEIQFTAELVCLTNGAPSSQSMVSTPVINVFPVLTFGVDFFRSSTSCVVAPVASAECAGNIAFTFTPTANLNPGNASVQVNYTARVIGAPNSCATSGRYTVSCPNCNDTAGDGTPLYQSVCWGESFTVDNTGALATSPGYFTRWTVSNAATGATITTFGPFGNPGNFSPNTFINNGSFLPAGGSYCFTPSLVFDGTDINPSLPGTQSNIVVGESNITLSPLNISAPSCSNSPACTCILGIPLVTDIDCYQITPGLYNGTHTFSGIPYCEGISSYNITITVTDNIGDLFNPFSQGGITSDFPAPLNQQNTDGTWTLFNYTGNPNGKSVNITAIYLNPFSTGNLSWNVTITYFNNPPYPLVCNTCHDVGEPSCVELLPPVQLAAIPTQAPICEGTPVNLTKLTPTSTQPGTFFWYDGNPATNGTLVLNPGEVYPTNGQTYFVLFREINDESCSGTQSVTFTVIPQPVLNTPPPLPPICLGGSIDLTSLNTSITTAAGTLQWYIGDPHVDGAPLETPNNVIPIGSERYYALFTDATTGCQNKLFVQANYHPTPLLLSVLPDICPGEQADLAALQPQLIADPGLFEWFTASGTQLFPNNQGQILVNPTAGTTYTVFFTSLATGCTGFTTVNFVINTLPTLVQPTVTNPVCAGEEVNLTQFESQITGGTAGTIEWFLGNPTSGGILLDGSTTQLNPATQTPTASDVYFLRFTGAATGCQNTISFSYPFAPGPNLTPFPANNFVCANAAPINLITLQPLISNNATFEWYLGDPATTGILLDGDGIPIAEDNPAAQPIPAGTTLVYYAILTSSTTGCIDTINLSYTAYLPLTGATANYNCDAGLQVNLSGVSGGSGAGYAVASNSPNQPGNVLDYLASWTVIVTDNAGCTQTLTGTSNCPTCEAGAANALANNRLCCGGSLLITNTTAVLDLPQDFVIGWAVTPQAQGPVTDAAGVLAANELGRVYQGNEDYSLNFDYTCLGLPTDYPPGRYLATPFISERPPEVGPPAPIVYNPAQGCLPDGEICPVITGSGWVINPMIITFPDGSQLNVNQELAFGAPIDETLLGLIGGTLPCLSLADLYSGDPNGIWTISITNTGTGSIGFSAPDFFVTVPAAGCSLLTQDQVNFVAGVSGLIPAGQTTNININVPSPQVVIPTLTYDPDSGCIPEGEFCPQITGSNWAINPLIITFPDGSQLNINDAAGGLTITPALLGALGGNLPCLALDSLFQGDPNGTWSIFVNNVGTGTVFFNIPDFEVVTDAASCTLISQDEVVTIPGTAGAVPPGNSLTLNIQVPPIPSLFPAINEDCNDYGAPVEIVLLGDITYQTVSATCVNNNTNLYSVSVTGLSGGAPQFIPTANYVFPAPATFNAATNTYTFQTTITAFPYTFQIANSLPSAGGGNCPVSATINLDPCICIPPVAGFATQCINDNQFAVLVNIAQTGSSPTYNITDNQGTPPQTGITAAGTYLYGVYANGTAVNVTLVSVADALCNLSSGAITDVCTPCNAGVPTVASNIVCCNDVATIVPQGFYAEPGNIIAWAVSISPITGPDDLVFASQVAPGVGSNYALQYENANCQLPAGFYYATPFIAQTPGEVPQPDPIVYNPALGCNPVGEICPLISGTGWVINPLIISFPDGSSINVAEQLIGSNVPITPDLLATVGGNLPCIPLSTLYNGNPNGTWTISVTNTGTGAVSFALPAFNVTVNAASCALISQDQVTTIGAVSGTIQGGASGLINIQIPNPNTEIPDFPTFDPNCQDFGESLQLTIVDPITFNLTAACNDSNNDGDFDQILVTVNSLAGGAPAIFSAAQYVLPTEFTQINPGVYQAALPLDLGQTNYTVSVGSSQPGQSGGCETAQTITLPFCPVGCLNPTVLFGSFCDNTAEGQFLVSANITDMGFGNAGYLITNSANSNTLTANATGIYQIGPFESGTPVTITLTGTTRPECVVTSPTLEQTCESCNAGTAFPVGGSNVVCCGETLSISSNDFSLSDGTIVAWAFGNSPITNPTQVANALNVAPGNANNGYDFTNDCSLDPGTYYLTPFIAQTPGEAPPAPPVIYDPALGCNPVGEICPVISGTGWAINPILISFPDGSTVNVVQQFLGANLTITPELLAGIGGLPCIPLSTLYNGDPNGVWTISVNNIGSGAVNFEIPGFDIVVDATTCPLITENQVTSLGAVSGTIAGNTQGSINIVVPNPNTEIPDFPTYNPTCQDFGDAIAVVVAEAITYNFTLACNDPDGDGVSSGYLATISNISGGSPAVVPGVMYVLPSGFTQTTPGVYTAVLPPSTSSPVSVTVGSTDSGCSTTLTQALPACFFACQPPVAGFLTACNEDGTYFVNVNVVNFGAGNTAYTITNNATAQTVTITGAGITQLGPFDAGTAVTVQVTGNNDATCSITGTPAVPDCTNCTTGVTNPIADDVICCGNSVTVGVTGANTASGNIIAWALSNSPVTNEAGLEDPKGVWPANADGSYTYNNNNCSVEPGVYYFTPFIAEDPGSAPPPDPIIYDPAIGCNPVGEICPIITGTNWVIDPLLITFPDGSTINVLQELAGLNIPITPALLGALGGLPCLPLSTLYDGDPNGTWTITINNTGTGAVNFEIPEFNVVVSAAGCPLITEDQVTTIGAVAGSVAGGTTGTVDIVIPNPNEVIIIQPEPDPIIYDPAIGCTPIGEICPVITGTGWVIDPLLISFPDGSTINVIQELAGLNVPITPALLAALGGLPCIPLSTLYDGDPNGTWTISVNNIGTGDVSFEIPEFNVVVSAAGCPLITEDQITVIGAVGGTVPGGTSGLIDIVIPNPLPPIESDFPTIDPNCTEFGEPVEVVFVDDINFTLTVACRDLDGNGLADDYLATISNLSGGAPEVLTTASYVLPAGFTETTPGVYTLSLPLSSSGVYSATVSSTAGGCAETKTASFPACITSCVPPTVTFLPDCLEGDTGNFYVLVTVSNMGAGNLSYTLSNSQNSATQTISATGSVQAGPFTNGSTVTLTLTGNNEPACSLNSNALSGNCTECFVGTAFIGAGVSGNVLCCGETLTVSLTNAILLSGNVVGWALSATPITSTAGLSSAVATFAANNGNGLNLTHNCTLPAGNYFLTPFAADAAGFPAVNAACEAFGSAVQVVLVDPITFDFDLTCYDPDGNGVADGYTATISNLSGGAPAVLPIADYVLPTGYTQTLPGVYTQTLSAATTGIQSAQVSSSVPGLTGNCAVTNTQNLPDCNFTCTPPQVVFTTNCLSITSFEAVVNVVGLGTGISYTLTDNQGTAPITITQAGTYNFGSYANNTNVLILLTDNTDNECFAASGNLTANCLPACTLPTVTFAPVCLGDIGFQIQATVTDLGSGTAFTLSDNQGSTPIQITDTGSYLLGLHANNTLVTATLTNNDDATCVVSSGSLSADCTPPPVCTLPTVTFTTDCIDENGFAAIVNLSALGSSGSYTITDNQGSTPQLVIASGVYTYGSYSNNTPVIVTITDNDDPTCMVVSQPLTNDCSTGCVPPVVTYSVSCVNTNLFAVAVTITGVAGSSYIITDNLGTAPQTVGASGTFNYGSYPSGSSVVISITEQGNSSCGVVSDVIIGDCSQGCSPPVVGFSVECLDTESYQVLVNIAALGSSATYTLSDNLGAVGSLTITQSGIYSFGPYASNTEVILTLVSEDNTNCNISSQPLSIDCATEQVPPVIPTDIVIIVPSGGQGVTFNVFDYVTDPNGDPMTLVDMEIPVAGGTLTFNSDGTVTFTPTPGFTGQIEIDFTVTDGTFTVSGTLIIDVVTGIGAVDIPNFALTAIVPVPAKEWVRLDFTTSIPGPVLVSVYDLTGRLVHTDRFDAQAGANSKLLNISAYPVGVYMLTLNNGVMPVTGKLVKD